MRSYSPDEFVSKLSADELPEAEDVKILGLAKVADEPSGLYFTSSASCERWSRVPVELVESIQHMATTTCRDHTHPVVAITFKQPDESQSGLAFLLGVLSATQRSLSRALSAASKQSGSAVSADDCTDCQIVNTPEGLQVCCWCPGNEIVCTGIA
ncbi:hypothetical protein ACIBCN_28650 [Nocardia sp. NPDC051052]|uniref:hypothetical protein n=1 Tax=Nocardia sp. NPDC051052 TaxID=3364322 RepID=UPI0037A2E814